MKEMQRVRHIVKDTVFPWFWMHQFSCSVMSHSLGPRVSQHTRPPCPSPTPGIYSNSCLSSRWCHPAISSSHPLLLLPPIPPRIRVFSNESILHMRWPKYQSFSFSISPSDEHSGLTSFRMDWLDGSPCSLNSSLYWISMCLAALKFSSPLRCLWSLHYLCTID